MSSFVCRNINNAISARRRKNPDRLPLFQQRTILFCQILFPSRRAEKKSCCRNRINPRRLISPDCETVWGVGVPVIAHLRCAIIQEANKIVLLFEPRPIEWPSSTISLNQCTFKREQADLDLYADAPISYGTDEHSSLSPFFSSSSKLPCFHSFVNR